MAINIQNNTVADHIVFDRIVDADRTITLARAAAEKAEAAGKQDTADKLRAKADALEKILLATQQPDYEDEEEDPPQNVGGGGSGDQGQGGSNNNENDGSDSEQDSDDGNGSETDDSDGSDEQSNNGSGAGDDNEKTPEDIAKMNNGGGGMKDHSSNTQKIGPGGSSGGADANGGGSGSGSGSGSSNNQKKNQSKELDPFKKANGNNGQQSKQPTPEEIMAAVIKRLSELGGNAKAGADRALKQLFGEMGGIGEIDD